MVIKRYKENFTEWTTNADMRSAVAKLLVKKFKHPQQS